MQSKTRALLMLFAFACLSVSGSYAQAVAKSAKTGTADLTAVVAKAAESAVFENGKLRYLRVQLPNDRERFLSFEYTKDKRSFTLVDDGRKTKVFVNETGRISALIFPDGKKATFDWVQASNGYWIPAAIKVDGHDLCRAKGNGINNGFIEEAGCYEICRDAGALSAIAIGVCVASGPLTEACWSATAAAALATYACYRCNNPQIEWPPQN